MSSKDKGMLTREQILATDNFEIEVMDVPGWGGKIRLRTMSGTARDKFDSQCVRQSVGDKSVDMAGLRTLLLTLCIVGEDNKPMFDKKDIQALNDLDSRAVRDVYEKVSKINGLGEEATEEAEKNSEGDQKNGSGSSSQPSSEVAQ